MCIKISKVKTLAQVRGTVQADILKKIKHRIRIFSTEFALRLMGDVQEYFIKQNVRNFYSVSISGYHIAEAGSEPNHTVSVYVSEWIYLRRILLK